MTPGKDSMQQVLLEMVGYLQERAEIVGNIDQRMIAAEASLRKYDRLITDGNGQPSVLAQLSIAQNNQQQMVKEIAGLQGALIELGRKATQMRVAFGTSLIAAITSLIVAYMSRH